MAERPTPILTAARGWPHWLAALLFGLLLLLALLIASWFLRACAPIEPSTNLTTLETPALPAPLPPTIATSKGWDEGWKVEDGLRARLSMLHPRRFVVCALADNS